MSERFAELQRQIEACANTGTPMPEYRCHKNVWALQIKDIEVAPKPTIADLEAILKEDDTPVTVNQDGSLTVEGERKETVGAIIIPAEGLFAPIAVSTDFMAKHKPQIGGYLVFYKDGYRSFSPAKAFEDGYTKV